MYQMNHKIEIPITLGLFVATPLALYVFKNKTPLNSSQIASLDKNDIWKIDRMAVEQTYSATFHKNIRTTSDLVRNTSVFLPAILCFDKNVRKDLFNLVFLYLETQAINSSLYAFAGVTFVKRKRPFVYYSEVPLESKFGPGAQDSFFSGHVSTAATASFFLAKVYIDYHPEVKNKKWILYASALIPPAAVGYYRYKALRHFPSDILVGIVVGAATGILVPSLHKVKLGKKQNLSLVPYTAGRTGLSVQLNF
jgi:membrane-associated phospholipid phosphatase